MVVISGFTEKNKWEFKKFEDYVCSTLKESKRDKDLMLMIGLDEAIDQLAMVNSVHWSFL